MTTVGAAATDARGGGRAMRRTTGAVTSVRTGVDGPWRPGG
ncbi:hypothetical protein AB0I72_24570 [Nocardiopsis sp. NPDC049922]